MIYLFLSYIIISYTYLHYTCIGASFKQSGLEHCLVNHHLIGYFPWLSQLQQLSINWDF